MASGLIFAIYRVLYMIWLLSLLRGGHVFLLPRFPGQLQMIQYPFPCNRFASKGKCHVSGLTPQVFFFRYHLTPSIKLVLYTIEFIIYFGTAVRRPSLE